MDTITKLLYDIKLPRMVRAEQEFDRTCLADVRGELQKQLVRPEVRDTVRPGMSIAITCGSRGIDNYPMILRELVAFCKDRGAKPFIIPAMGSHGGAVAEGQRKICETLGVTEEYCGCPIRATMDVTMIGMTADGSNPVFIDSFAAQADGIIIANRIKNHAFKGDYESGMMKMMTIGLGKQYGASVCHRWGYKHMARLIPLFGNAILKHAPILFGVGLVENAYDKTCKVAVMANREIPLQEPALRNLAEDLLPRLLPGKTDVLIVDYMGKNYSGSGMDPNITGRVTNQYAREPRFYAEKIAVLDVTDQSHGNVHGIGYVDVMSKRIFDKADLDVTYPNSITSTTLKADKLPVIMKNDREAIQCAIKTCNAEDPSNPHVIRIRNTLHISEIWLSEGMLDSVRDIPNLKITDEKFDWEFNEQGNLW